MACLGWFCGMVGSSLRIFACLHAHPHIDWSSSWSPVQQSILTGVRPLVNKQAQQGRICGSMVLWGLALVA